MIKSITKSKSYIIKIIKKFILYIFTIIIIKYKMKIPIFYYCLNSFSNEKFSDLYKVA